MTSLKANTNLQQIYQFWEKLSDTNPCRHTYAEVLCGNYLQLPTKITTATVVYNIKIIKSIFWEKNNQNKLPSNLRPTWTRAFTYVR